MRRAYPQGVSLLQRPLSLFIPPRSFCSNCAHLTDRQPATAGWQQTSRSKSSVSIHRTPSRTHTLERKEREKRNLTDPPGVKMHPSVRAREDLMARSRMGSKRLFVPRRLKSPQDDAGKALRAQFDELQRLLQNPKNLEAMWLAYEKIRQTKDALALMSPDLFRLLVLHFKAASRGTTARSYSLSTSATQKAKIAQKTWAARVMTVLVDKRDNCKEDGFSKWETSDMMAALNRGERYEEALQELSQCLATGEEMDPILLNHAVRAWGGLGRLDKAMELIQDKRHKVVARASEYTLSYMLQQFLLNGQREKALDLWVAIRALPMENPKTADGILRACSTKRDIEFAQMVYEELPKMGIEATVDALDIMAGMAVSNVKDGADRAQILQTIFTRMSNKDHQVFRSSTLESILVNFCKKGDMEGAMLVVHLMDHYGIPTTLRYHNALLRGFGTAGDMSGAVRWFNYMRREGCAPDLASYRSLILTFVRNRRPREAEALFRQMIVDRLQPDSMLCNQLLLAYEHAKMTRRCLQLYLTMFRDRLGLNHESFSCLFNAVFHRDKAEKEGGEGFGTSMGNRRFLAMISEPIAKPRGVQQSDGAGVTSEDTNEMRSVYPMKRQQYQFAKAESHTNDLNPRSIFRDMIIVGVLPTTTLYGNIIRAFLAKEDYPGAYVALRAMSDYHLLKPTPKISAIVLSWVYAELELRGPSETNAVTKGELAKLSHMMGRTRGLIDMLEKIVCVERWQPHPVVATTEQDARTTTLTYTNSMKHTDKVDQVLYEQQQQPEEIDDVNRAVQDMGGDLVDLFQRGVYSGSAQKRLQDEDMQVDLTDFERWFESYLPRVKQPTFADQIEDEDPELD